MKLIYGLIHFERFLHLSYNTRPEGLPGLNVTRLCEEASIGLAELTMHCARIRSLLHLN